MGRCRTSEDARAYISGVMALAANSCVAFRRATVRSFPSVDHHSEQAWCYSLSRQHYACAIDQCACFHFFFGGEVTEQLFGFRFGEDVFGSGVAVAQFYQQLAHMFVMQEFFYRCGIGLERVGEEGSKGCGKVFEAAGTRLEQVDGGKQPVMISLRGIESCFVPFFLNQRQQFFRRIGADVFGVEPVQLGAIEDGVGVRDAIQIEQAD